MEDQLKQKKWKKYFRNVLFGIISSILATYIYTNYLSPELSLLNNNSEKDKSYAQLKNKIEVYPKKFYMGNEDPNNVLDTIKVCFVSNGTLVKIHKSIEFNYCELKKHKSFWVESNRGKNLKIVGVEFDNQVLNDKIREITAKVIIRRSFLIYPKGKWYMNEVNREVGIINLLCKYRISGKEFRKNINVTMYLRKST